MKVYKHFRNWLAVDDVSNLFLCKKNEFSDIDEENPWNNLQIVELEIDHENDVDIRIIPSTVIFTKKMVSSSFRVVIPANRNKK